MISAGIPLRPISPARISAWRACADALVDKAADDAHLLVMCHDAFRDARDMGSDSDRVIMAHEDLRQARKACRRTEKACHRIMEEIGRHYHRGTTPSDLPLQIQGIINMISHAHSLIWNVAHL